jgi:DNA-binding NarL/FixJ family response regulator
VILVIDQHRVYRSGVRQLIEARIPHSRVVEGSELEGFAANQHYDLILVDSGSLRPRLLDWLNRVHELSPATRFAVVSTSTNRADVLSCLSAGFHGFVHKLQSDEDLLAAIGDLLSGRIYLPRWLADSEYDRSEAAPSTNSQVESLKLTRRQNEILPLIAQGMSNKEISSRLNIAEGTTKIHTAAVLRALGARNRTEAAFMAAKLVGSSIRCEGRFKNERFVIRGLGRTDKG